MKKIIAILFIILGTAEIYAYNSYTSNKEVRAKETYTSFTTIDIDKLPSNIQELLLFEFKDYIVKSVEVKTNKGNNIYQVTLIDSENYEYIIYINDKGIILE